MTIQLNDGANVTSAPVPGPRQAPAVSTSRPFDSAVRKLREDCAALGVVTPVPLRVRVALRRRLHLRQRSRTLLGRSVLVVMVLAAPLLSLLVMARVAEKLESELSPSWHAFLFGPRDAGPLPTPSDILPPVWGAAIEIASSVAVGLWGVFYVSVLIAERQAEFGKRRTQLARLLLARRYTLVFECAEVIGACARARGGGERQPTRIKEVSQKLSAVRRSVLNAHKSRRSLPLFTERRKRLKEHQRKVAAALHDLEAQLDQDPGRALREIAEAMVTIADRYCEGRNGALLDEDRLTGVPRQRDWDALRYLLALGLAAGGITALALTEFIPESAESYVFIIVAVAAFVIAWGRKFRRALDVVGVIAGQP
ncbi:hypothetical protein HTV80_00205 [Streptomyces sp. Vc74B-19]|uniref:hypothetical protein n=1 Tax=Streptomyces sp. Vc74B-19 TaxID=2741324 RepID=UPI001BFCBA39|nr:hypothetical protein [Streptomyces sp. Vc74B-19]MBT3161536.1 hypothetical protein [Streptomyces sp. Vc74B-19]